MLLPARIVTASVTLGENTNVSFSNSASNTDGGLGTTAIEEGTSSDDVTRSGNSITGGYTFTETENSSSTLTENDTVAQASSLVSNTSATTYSNDYSYVSANGNDVTGAASTSEYDTSSSTLTKNDSDERPIPLLPDTDTQTITTTDTTSSYQTGNNITGSFSMSDSDSETVNMNESGTRAGNNFSAASNESSSSGGLTTGNSITGAEFTSETTTDTTVTGNNGLTASGSYTIEQTDNSTVTMTGDDNSIVGNTSTTSTSSDSSSISESSNVLYSSNAFWATENTTATHSIDEAGNTVTGAYSNTDHETDSSSLTQNGTNNGGTYSLTATTSEWPVTYESGDTIAGDYTFSEAATQDYSFSEVNSTVGGGRGGSGSSFSLVENGVKGYSLTQSGSHVTGDYTMHETGSDGYSISENGGTSSGSGSGSGYGSGYGSGSGGNAWNLSLSGTDDYTIDEQANELSGEFARTTSGSGSDTLSEGGSLSTTYYNHSPSTAYTVSESGDYLSGQITLTETGTDRYALINGFNNVTSALPSNGNGPGDIEYSPVGAPFQMGGNPYWGTGPGPELNVAAADAAYDEQGMQLLHEYCWRRTAFVLVADDNERPTRAVPKLITEIRPGDKVLCPSDKDPYGPATWKEVLRTFKNRPAALLALTTDRGNVVYPTTNHPIFIVERGWVPAGSLKPGDPLLSRDGRALRVATVVETGLIEDVYNLQVADNHTYFVSDGDGSFSLLAHNVSAKKSASGQQSDVPRLRVAGAESASDEERLARQLSAAQTIPLQLAMPDGSVRPLGEMSPDVYKLLGAPPIVADEHHQIEAAELGIATPADLVTEELAGILGEVGLIPGEPVFAALTSGAGWASRYASYFDAPVTMMSGESQQYAVQNAGLGYRVMGAAPLITKPEIAAEALVFGPSSVRVWQDRMAGIDVGTSVTPYVSDARDVKEVWTGEDAVTGERLHWWGQRGITTAAMVIPFVAGAWFRRVDGQLEEAPLVGPYRYMSQISGGQTHHINPVAIYGDIIAFQDGMCVKLHGNAIFGRGSPHYVAHEPIEAVLSKYRRGAGASRNAPTNLEITRAAFDGLVSAGKSREEAFVAIREALRERVRHGLLGGVEIPKIPSREWQR